MYESYEVLHIKEKSGIASAGEELQYRKKNKVKLPFSSCNGSFIYMVQTKDMKERLESIRSLYEKVNTNQKIKDIILLDAFHSATIEGARTTVQEVRRIYDTPKTKDDKMVINTICGMNYAYRNPVTLDNIRELWDIVIKDVCENSSLAGTFFRSGMVYVGSHTDIIHTPAAPEQIEGMMQELFTFMQSTTDISIWIKSAIVHFYFVYIHPFCDGNGRMARIITQSFLMHNGVEKIQYLPLSRTINEHLSGYYMSLKESETVYKNGEKWMDITPFLDYMLTTVEQCMLTSLKENQQISDR